MIEKLTHDPTTGFQMDKDGVAWTSRADYLKQGVLPLCGCGDSDAILRWIVEMFRLHVGQSTWDTNSSEDMSTMFFLSWATSQDYIEHGATLRCSWMTPKGEELLRDIETVLQEGTATP
jgi:hypothetical protein